MRDHLKPNSKMFQAYSIAVNDQLVVFIDSCTLKRIFN